MNVTVVLKGSLFELPPVYSAILNLSDLGCKLTVVCDTCTSVQLEELNARSIKTVQLHSEPRNILPSALHKLLKWHSFKVAAWEAMSENPGDLFWIGSADTCLALGTGLFAIPYVLHVHELYDTRPLYRNRMGRYMQGAKSVVVSEITRAHIFRAWYHLKETPIAMPNKPYYHPRQVGLGIRDEKAAVAFAKIPKDSQIVFYQGGVSDRRDIKPIARLINELGRPFALALQMPESNVNDPYYKELKANYDFYRIPYVPAPMHLDVTSNVQVGLVTYTHLQMNNEFCAPNKIWEYSGFGMPMIGNDVKGMVDTVGRFKAGLCLNLDYVNQDVLKGAFLDMMEHRDEFSKNAIRLFESVDMVELTRKVLDRAGV